MSGLGDLLPFWGFRAAGSTDRLVQQGRRRSATALLFLGFILIAAGMADEGAWPGVGAAEPLAVCGRRGILAATAGVALGSCRESAWRRQRSTPPSLPPSLPRLHAAWVSGGFETPWTSATLGAIRARPLCADCMGASGGRLGADTFKARFNIGLHVMNIQVRISPFVLLCVCVR